MKRHPGPSRTPSLELAVIDSKDWWYHAGQEFSVAGGEQGRDLPLRGHLAMSGDVFDYQ